jgi:hypothetical protein
VTKYEPVDEFEATRLINEKNYENEPSPFVVLALQTNGAKCLCVSSFDFILPRTSKRDAR